MKTTYEFTEQERLYFDRLQQEFQLGVNAGLRLIMTQQNLQGAWQLKPDRSGLELPSAAPPLPQPSDADKQQPLEKLVNGVA